MIKASLEITKEIIAEITKETAKVTTDMIKFGKAGNEVTIEHVNLGKLNSENAGNHISFGSLASGEFKKDARYLKWKNGINNGELNKKWIEELTNEISAIFGNDIIKAMPQYLEKGNGLLPYRFNNAGIQDYLGRLFYDPKYLKDKGNQFGEDNILGTLAHEVGHRVVYNLGLESKISAYENEACADYIAGLTTRLCKLNSAHKLAWYNTCPSVSCDDIHPGKSVRIESFSRGFDRIDRGDEAIRLRLFETFSPYDLEGVYRNSELLSKILYEDIINPLRNGEITKV